jgi:hypothetical protein
MRFGAAASLLVTILRSICQNQCDARHRTIFDKTAFVQPQNSNARAWFDLRSPEHTNNHHLQWAFWFVVVSLALNRLAALNLLRSIDPCNGSRVRKRSGGKWPAETVVSPFSVRSGCDLQSKSCQPESFIFLRLVSSAGLKPFWMFDLWHRLNNRQGFRKNDAINTRFFDMLSAMAEALRHHRQHAEENDQYLCLSAVFLFTTFVNVRTRVWFEHPKRRQTKGRRRKKDFHHEGCSCHGGNRSPLALNVHVKCVDLLHYATGWPRR